MFSVIIIMSVLNGILVLLRAATAVYTVYDIYILQYFASTSPLNSYFRSCKKCTDRICLVLYVCRSYCLLCRYVLLVCVTRVFHCKRIHSRISLLRRFTTVERLFVILLAALSYFQVLTDKYNNVYYSEEERITYHSAGGN